MMSEEGSDDGIVLLMFGGLVRDDFPWLYEILVEAYREIRAGDAKAGQKAIERLRRVTKVMGRGPFMDEMLGDGSKEAHMMMRELPMILDHFLHRFERRRLKGASESETDQPQVSSE